LAAWLPRACLGRGRGQRRTRIESEVRYATITIIEGHDATQYGIGIASARVAEMVLRDERAAIAIGSYHPAVGVTLSLPTLIGRTGAVAVLQSELSPDERIALEKSAEILGSLARSITKWAKRKANPA
jgi:L-lactate dehydrogenase